LRASLRQSEDAEFKAGFAVGKEWAENQAEAVQLKRLDALYEILSQNPDPHVDWESSFVGDKWHFRSVAEWLFAEIKGFSAEETDRFAADDFWQQQYGENPPAEGESLRGFAEGALEVWWAVEKQL
jgi:hypothetical protein